MEGLSRWASLARAVALISSLAIGLLIAAPMLLNYPLVHVFLLAYAGVGLLGGYVVHVTLGRGVVKRLVSARAARLARDHDLDAGSIEALAHAYVV